MKAEETMPKSAPMMNAESLYEQIQNLSAEERMKLNRLLGIVPDMNADEQAALDAEIEHSLDDVDAVRVVSADDVIAKLQARDA